MPAPLAHPKTEDVPQLFVGIREQVKKFRLAKCQIKDRKAWRRLSSSIDDFSPSLALQQRC